MGLFFKGLIGVLCILFCVTTSQDVPGPETVICSKAMKKCIGKDNIYQNISDVPVEIECQRACNDVNECHAYTWYDENAFEEENKNTCYLLANCDDYFHDNHAYSGPKNCYCEKPVYHPHSSHWKCRKSNESSSDVRWDYQWTDCDLICSNGAQRDHIRCDAEYHRWNPPPEDFSCGCTSTFPNNLSYADDSWACMDENNHFVSPSHGIIVDGTTCKQRCYGQGNFSQGSYKCQYGKWKQEQEQEPSCAPNENELLYFFTTTQTESGVYSKNIENPHDSNNIKAGEFTCNSSGLHLFTLVRGRNGEDIKLKLNTEDIVTIPKDSDKNNSITIALDLKAGQTVNIIGKADLKFTGLSLYGTNHKPNSKYFWGSGVKQLQVQNKDQPIILDEVYKGHGINYAFEDGTIKILTAGVYMTTLNLDSEDSSYASLDINGNKILGLGEDRDGHNMMGNFILKEFQDGDTIRPTLDALSKIENEKSTQLSTISLLHEVRNTSFCAYSTNSDIYDVQDPVPVKFNEMFLNNDNFAASSGTYTHPSEDFNPRRYYLLSATAFMRSMNLDPAILRIEQFDPDINDYIQLGTATTSSQLRSMLQIMVIAEMDQIKNKVRVTAKGLMDEGPDVYFATFCGFRLGL